MQKPQAAGSAWNPNSWHWEMKNISEVAKKRLQDKILTMQCTPNKELTIRHTKVVFNKSDAQINIRKGKPIFVFDFDLQLEVSAEYLEQMSDGSYHAKEILTNSLDDIIIDNIKAKEKNKAGQELKKWVKNNARKELERLLIELEKELLIEESDPAKLEEDKKKREENKAAIQKALEEKGAQKERLLQLQREKQNQLKLQSQIKELEKRNLEK